MEETKKATARKSKKAAAETTPTLSELLRADQELRAMWKLIRDYDLREKALDRLDRTLARLGKRPLTVH